MENNIHIHWYKIPTDILILIILGLPILILFLAGAPFERGFYCDDTSLRHPYKDSTVPSFYLYIFGIGLNGIAIVVAEYLRNKNCDRNIIFCGRKVPYWIWQIYLSAIVFFFGMACSQMLTDCIKYLVGRLRPHFYTVCMPKFDGKTCDSLNNSYYKYIEHYTCTQTDKRKLKEMRLSFPSGHSSYSMYTALFFVIFLQSRWKTCEKTKMLKHFVQFLAILAAIMVGMSRISDYKHHWSDVLGGLLLGGTVAIVTTVCVSDLFDKKTNESNSSKPQNPPSELTNLNGNNPA